MRAGVLAALVLALAACATPRPPAHAPATPHAPPRPHVDKPSPPKADAHSIDPANYREGKERLRTALARNPDDSLAPAETGYYMDVLQGRLQQIGGSDIGMARDGERIVLTLLGAGADRAADAKPLHVRLVALAKALADYRKTLISVQGEAGGDARKAARCTRLAVHLLTGGGVAAQHIAAVGPTSAAVPADANDLGDCSSIVLQLEPIVRTTEAR